MALTDKEAEEKRNREIIADLHGIEVRDGKLFIKGKEHGFVKHPNRDTYIVKTPRGKAYASGIKRMYNNGLECCGYEGLYGKSFSITDAMFTELTENNS